jgi:uncharacterized membrane protein
MLESLAQQLTTRGPIASAVERHPRLAAALVSCAVAYAVVAPFLWRGNASGHDFEFHLRSWIDAAHSWHAGVWFPRWGELANWKYGEPRFIFYPPLSWMLGAALAFVLPWSAVPGAFCVLALALAGMTMAALARDYLPPLDAALAGALYAANPYSLLVVYFRSAFAELLVAALLPLVVLYALRLPRARWRAVAPLALVFGLIWMTNAPGAVLTSYALALLLAVVAWQEYSPSTLWLGGVAIALGFCLAAFYILPAAREQDWVQISQVLSEGLKPEDNFLFSRIADVEHTRFNFIVSWIAIGELVAIGVVAALAFRREALGRARWPLVALGAVAGFLMFSFTQPLWRVLPKFVFLQFPWRWLVALGVVYALALAAALRALRWKAFAYVGIAAALVVTAQAIMQRTWWDPRGAGVVVKEALGTGYDGSDEYAPLATDHYDLEKNQPPVSFMAADGTTTDARRATEIERWLPEQKQFTITTEAPARVMVHLVNYPAWRVKVNGHWVEAETRTGTGEIIVPVAAGKSEVRVQFIYTPDRTWGAMLSVVGLALLGAIFLASRRSRPTSAAVPTSM